MTLSVGGSALIQAILGIYIVYLILSELFLIAKKIVRTLGISKMIRKCENEKNKSELTLAKISTSMKYLMQIYGK